MLPTSPCLRLDLPDGHLRGVTGRGIVEIKDVLERVRRPETH
jgi:hypothetical protein